MTDGRFPRRAPAKRRGFTLVEVMAALAVMAFLLVLLTEIFNSVSSAWSKGESQMQIRQAGRAVADFIRADLQTALAPLDVRDPSGLQFVLNPPELGASPIFNRDALFWQAPIATDRRLGDVAEVGYFVRWDAERPEHPKASLCRFFVNPAEPGAGGGAVPNPHFLIYASPAAWLSDSLLAAVAPADRSNGYRGLFAENTLGMWVRCLDPDGEAITEDANGNAYHGNFDSRRGYRHAYLDSGGSNVSAVRALPAAVELGFVMVGAREAARIGPSEKAAIVQLTGEAESAEDFVQEALAHVVLGGVAPAFRPYATTVHLQNAR